MENKISIPNTCMIGSMTYRIRWSDQMLEAMDYRAHISSIGQIVRLSRRRDDQVMVSLLHEILHGLAHEFNLNDEDEKLERFCSSFAHGLAIFLRSVGVDFSFDKITEESEDAK